MTALVPARHKFCCLALPSGLSAGAGLPFSNAEIVIASESPLEIADHWRESLGSVQSRQWRDARLFLIVMQPSDIPATFDAVDRALEQRVFLLLYSLQMYGYRGIGRALIVATGLGAEKAAVKAAGTVELVNPGNSIRQFADGALVPAVECATQLNTVLNSQQYVRFKRGLRAWVAGTKAVFLEDRLHQFARSVEALLKPETGNTKRQFTHRCQTFIGSGPVQQAAAGEIYDLRSATEHLNSYSDALSQHKAHEREHLASLRSFQMETIANKVYSKILTTPLLLEVFQDDSCIEDFWQRPDDERAATWGTPIDLNAEENDYFR